MLPKDPFARSTLASRCRRNGPKFIDESSINYTRMYFVCSYRFRESQYHSYYSKGPIKRHKLLPEAVPCVNSRFGKSTHISMISNSVTHLRSYTNSDIAVNSAPISPVTPRDRRRLRIEPRQVWKKYSYLHD